MTKYADISRYGRGIRRHRLLTVSFYIDPREVRVVTVSLARFWFVTSGLAVAAISGVAILFFILRGDPGKPVSSPVAARSSEASAVAENGELVEPLTSPPAVANVEVSFASKVTPDSVKELAASVGPVNNVDNGKFTTDTLPVLSREKEAFCKVTVDQNWLTADDGSVIIGLTIENLQARAITGRVWGVASYGEFADKLYVGSASAVDVMQPDVSSNRILGQTYSARKATRKELEFKVPPGKVINEVTIFVDEGPGGEKIFYDSIKR